MLSRPRTSAAMQSTANAACFPSLSRHEGWMEVSNAALVLRGEVRWAFFFNAPVTQRIEQLNSSQPVVGSIPAGRAIHSNPSSNSKHIVVIAALINALRTMRRSLRRAHWSSISCVVMCPIFWAPQPATQPVNQSIFSIGAAVMDQSEFFFPRAVAKPQWVDVETVKAWGTWRDAVLWCWEHRPHRGMNESGDQSTFRHFCERDYKVRVHAPHVSRWVNPATKAPMDLPPDLVSAFEEFTGWRGLTQFFNRKAKATVLEEMQARMAA